MTETVRTVDAARAAGAIRVVQVVRSLETGGQEVLCARLVERLDPKRFHPVVLCLQRGGWLARRLESRGIPIRCLEGPEGLRPELVPRLAAVLRRERADIVHCHNRKAFLYGGLAAALVRQGRLVLTKHGASGWPDGATAALGRLLLLRTRAVVAVSEQIAGALKGQQGVREERLYTVPNGVDTDEFRPTRSKEALRAALGLERGRRLVGTVGRLAPEKDQPVLLRAFARVLPEFPDAQLLLVGDGPLRFSLEALAAELRVPARFLGERQDVARVLGALDVFCLPSLTEGMSVTLLEAMASGLPVVATAVGGTPEVVGDGENGLLVPPKRPDLLAEALGKVLRDRAAGLRMGRQARETVLARHSLAAMVERYAAIYETVCGRNAGGGGG